MRASRVKALNGYRIGRWTCNQRAIKNSISQERKARLEALPNWTWDVLSDQWEEGFCYLKEFAEREGHTAISRECKASDGYPIGTWMGTQRAKRGALSPERQARLEKLPGWSWDARLDNWENGYAHLKEFVDREGHAKVPDKHEMTDGYPLGGWVSTQRIRSGKLTQERKARLELLPGWSWDPFLDQWEVGFRNLAEFAEREGHARAPRECQTTAGYRLGSWVGVQRQIGVKMGGDRKARLEALPGWSWDPHSDMWEKGFDQLSEFAHREGHTKVTHRCVTEGGYRLGLWVSNQKANRDSMSPERRARLESLPGWVWRVK